MTDSPHKKHPCYLLHRWLNWLANQFMPSGSVDGVVRVISQIVIFSAPILLALLPFCDPNDQYIAKREYIKVIVTFIYENRLILACALLFLHVSACISLWLLTVLRPINPDRAVKVMQTALERHFSEPLQWEKHDYRATLFKIRGWRWLTGEWLGIICRTGDLHDKSRTIFSINRMDVNQCTGIAGACFASNCSVIIQTRLLPDAKTDPDRYMAECGLAKCEFDDMNVKSVLVFAAGIRRKGKPWGILVLDTTDPEKLPSRQMVGRKKVDIGDWAAVLGLLLD